MIRNPLKDLRIRYGYTQEQLAEKLGITRQIVMDVELGMFAQPPPSLVAYLAKYQEHHILELKREYQAWVQEKRGDGMALQAFQRLTEPPSSFSALCHSVGGSIRGFCRTIVIQRSIVVGYIDSNHRWDSIASALSDCGLPVGVVEMMGELPR